VAAEVHWAHGLADLQRAWNAHLPSSIVVWRVREAPAGFHPRFSAVERTYRYTVYSAQEGSDAPVRTSPLTDRYGLYVTQALAVDAMQRAAAVLVGEHDFATFGQPPQGEGTVRKVRQAEWSEAVTDLPGLFPPIGRRLLFTISANAFLRQMVRSVVGSLIAVGSGRWTVADFAAALLARDRSRSAPPVAPNGLLLAKITYPAAIDVLAE
jgi:tRNA pseudouridine38-40 synthase